MALRFQTFRCALCFIICLTAAIAIGLGAALSYIFFHQGTLWLLLAVEAASFMRSTWSLIRKKMFNSPQTVASETVGLFILFPFQLIITLLAPTMTPRPGLYTYKLMALKVFSVTSGIIHLTYTLSLVTVAILTVPAFDPDVWMRDIDSSPSPFPVGIISDYLFPCFGQHHSNPQSSPRSVSEGPPPTPCLPTCSPNCTFHGRRTISIPKESPYGSVSSSAESLPLQEAQKKGAERKPPVLPHTLIRIPNATERRASIFVELPIS
ncbi:hypothetical protein D9613_000366 [Agrocybe pediades]|uniref:Transmembrane protein n=1 Tax=Agrocybe pediades TaxID=84607 RepID=A0A8H4VSN8_9AGAR|nr:hypothetical protein D9613_000366 [Agrocybe pediades]